MPSQMSAAPPALGSPSLFRGGLRHKIRVAAITTFAAAIAGLASGIAQIGSASAQNALPGSILDNGNAVTTGFSGARPFARSAPQSASTGADPADQMTIDLGGPSARIINLQNTGGPPQAQLINAPKPFTVTAGQVGQVFAVTLDNATPPNIYLAATSAYGLPIVAPAPDGSPRRARQGAPNAQFMPGLFGPARLGGGPGSVWRVDGATGDVRLFANVTLDGVANSGPALGGLAFDPASRTIFVADRGTGMIHRFDLSGAERGRFDHGVQGRASAGLPPVAFDSAKRLDIAGPEFQSEQPETWVYAALPRLIFGLAVRGGRLYYAVAEGLEVWSVSIAPDGTFGTDARVELQVPVWDGRSEISKIMFDNQGQMLLAERAAPTGAYDFEALAQDGVGRVLRYRPVKPAGADAARWQQEPDEYAIGFPSQLRNGNGGVAIGFGYAANGALDRASCGGFLWSTGEQLRNSSDPAIAAQLASGGPAIVNGLQGNAINLVRPTDVPPFRTYFVSYDDNFNDGPARGHLGDVAILRICGGAAAPMMMEEKSDVLIDGGGACRFGEYRLRDGECCDRSWVREGRCYPPHASCPPGEIGLPNGQCCNREDVREGRCRPIVCPPGEVLRDGRCVPPPIVCPPGKTELPNGQCCDREDVRAGRCGPIICLPGEVLRDGKCMPPPIICPPGEVLRDGRCVPSQTCPPGEVLRDGKCVPSQTCPPGEVLRDGRCVPSQTCPPGEVLRDGKCMPPPIICPPGEVLQDGRCVPSRTPCLRGPDGKCGPIVKVCPRGEILTNGNCVPSMPPSIEERPRQQPPSIERRPRQQPPRYIAPPRRSRGAISNPRPNRPSGRKPSGRQPTGGGRMFEGPHR